MALESVSKGLPAFSLNGHSALTNGRAYQPLSSVWTGSDADLREAMFDFLATISTDPIPDATYNAGRFWKNSKRRVVSMDLDARHQPMIVADNRVMPGVPARKFL